MYYRAKMILAYNAVFMELDSLPRREATFIEPMECLAVPKLPDDSNWVYEIKLDGYRALAVKSAGRLNLFSRRRNSFNTQYSLVFDALADLPDNTVVDGEVEFSVCVQLCRSLKINDEKRDVV